MLSTYGPFQSGGDLGLEARAGPVCLDCGQDDPVEGVLQSGSSSSDRPRESASAFSLVGGCGAGKWRRISFRIDAGGGSLVDAPFAPRFASQSAISIESSLCITDKIQVGCGSPFTQSCFDCIHVVHKDVDAVGSRGVPSTFGLGIFLKIPINMAYVKGHSLIQ